MNLISALSVSGLMVSALAVAMDYSEQGGMDTLGPDGSMSGTADTATAQDPLTSSRPVTESGPLSPTIR